MDRAKRRGFLVSPAGVAMLAFLAIAGFFIWTEHRAHLFGVLPFVLVLLCPLLHFFHHRSHGNDHGHGTREERGGAGGPRP